MKTADITTTQNVTITYELASLWDRVVAFLVDMVVIVIAAVILAFLLFGTFNYLLTILIAVVLPSLLNLILVSLLFLLLSYFIIGTLKFKGQTLGKRVINLRVMKYNGQDLELGDVLLRELFRYPEVLMTLGSFGALLIGATERSQRLGDILANTVVVKQNVAFQVSLKGLLSLKTAEDYSPEYPEVTRLKEDELVLVKQTLDRVRQYPTDAHYHAADELATFIEEKLRISRGEQAAKAFLQQLSRDYVILTR